MKKILSLFTALAIIAAGSYMFFEPQIMDAAYDEVSVSQAVTGEISITQPGDVTMLPAIAAMTGGTGTGTSTWTVTTTQSTGYNLQLTASTSPALKNGATDSFADYTPTAPTVPDYAWSVGASAAEFGYTVEGTDTATLFKDNGSTACNTGSTLGSYTCWLNASTTVVTIATKGSSAVGGDATSVGYRAEAKSGSNKISGTYTATIGATATVQ